MKFDPVNKMNQNDDPAQIPKEKQGELIIEDGPYKDVRIEGYDANAAGCCSCGVSRLFCM